MRPISRVVIQMVDVASSTALIEEHIANGMPMVGFHYIVDGAGIVEVGRSISAFGNHLTGHNSNSIGIACIGTELTKKQELAIDSLLEELEMKVPNIKDVFIVEDGELKIYK